MKDSLTYTGVGVTAALSEFVRSSLEEIAVWLVVMSVVIVADLMSGLYKIGKRKERFRLTKGMRDTMAKLAAYFSFVVSAVFVQNATGHEALAKWACVLVIVGEGISIFGNLLKAHGYNLNVRLLVKHLLGKARLDENLIEKEGEKE